jgi:CheY-like chemotaxis protein
MYRILIVDDQHEVRRMLAAGVRTLGPQYEVLDVPSAEEALLISTRLRVDLMVSDVRLPGISGLELIQKVRKRSPEAKIFLITGIDDPNVRRQVTQAAVEAYFFKPVSVSAFLNAVEQCLNPAGDTSPAQRSDQQLLEASPPAAPTMAERLADLRQELQAFAVVLIDDQGQPLGQAGDLAELDWDVFLAALLPAISANRKLVYTLGDGEGLHILNVVGRLFNLAVTEVGSTAALLVVTRPPFTVEGLSRNGKAMQLACVDLKRVLDQIGIVEQPVGPEAVEIKPLQMETALIDNQELSELEALFGQAAQTIQPDQADAFWDELTDQEMPIDQDALSYEQARKLGLAPDEQAI